MSALRPLLAPPGPSWPLLLLPRQDGGEVSQSLGETLKLPPRRFLPTGVSAWPLSSSASITDTGTWPQVESGPVTQPEDKPGARALTSQ